MVFLLAGISATAMALNVTDHDLYDWFEYYRDGAWHDLNTVMYFDMSNGNVGYCVEHEAKPPRESIDYTPFDPATMFTGTTMTGIQAILNHGFPAKNAGLSDDDAFYATANAIRFWIKESCGQGYDFMLLSNGGIRVKPGGETVWNWCMELLNYARAQDVGSNATVHLSTLFPKWSLINGQLVTTLNVTSTYGYSVTANQSNVTISGYTGGRNDTLTITAPASLIGSEVSLYFTATVGNVSSVDLGWYEPYDSTRQKLVFIEMITGTTGMSQIIGITGSFYDLTINKTDAVTSNALDGATFQLTQNGSAVGLVQTAEGQYASGGTITQFTTSGGTAVLSNLPVGDYKLVELSAPTAYVAAAVKSISLTSDSSVTIANAPTELTITKTNALTSEAMSGVAFTLFDDGGNPVSVSQTADGQYRYDNSGNTTFLTDNNGKATVSYLPIGSYTLREAATDGFVTESDLPVSFTGSNAVSIRNQPTVLAVTKTDSVTGESLDGGVFQIKDENGDAILLSDVSGGAFYKNDAGGSTFTTNGGEATIYGLPAGQYTVTEVQAPQGYTRSEDRTVTVSSSSSPSSPAALSISDSPLALRFTKTDALTGEPVDGAAFSLYNGKTLVKLRMISEGVYTPDDSGSATFTTTGGSALIAPLAVGTYTVSEEQVADGYAPAADESGTIMEDHSSENPLAVTMVDAPLALTIQKLDSVTGQLVDGATFRLFDSHGNVVSVSPIAGRSGWYCVNKNGSADFAVPDGSATIVCLPQDAYELQEVSAAFGYALAAGTTTTVVGSYNTCTSPATVTVENKPLAVLLEKVDALDKSPLANVSFRITDANGDCLHLTLQEDGTYYFTCTGEDCFQTDSDGKASILYIPVGTYTLEEQQHPGFAPIGSQAFTVTSENTVDYPSRIGVENWPLYLKVAKTDKLSGEALENVEFKLLDSSGSSLHFTLQEDGRYKVTATGSEIFRTDENGEALISHVPAGTYQLVEQPYDGYGVHDPVTVTISNTNTEENSAAVSIENCPTELVMTKTDVDTGVAIAGVEFTLVDSDGKTVSLAHMQDGTYRPASAVIDTESMERYSDRLVTDSFGMICVQYLSQGFYTLDEQQVYGYAPLVNIAFEITSACSTESPLTMTVKNTPTSLVISKTNAVTQAALPGTRFQLLDKDGAIINLVLEEDGTYRPAGDTENSVDELTIGEDGTATVRYIIGKVTIHESYALPGFAYAKDQLAEIGTTAIAAMDGDRALAVTNVKIEDLPLTLKISKIHAKTLKPLNGAAFQIIPNSAETPFAFVLLDGVYWYSEAGTITTITMDSNAQAYVCGLPAGKYRLVESVTPSGFFPAPAQDFTLQLTDTANDPLELVVTNTPEVKLGLDSDKWDDALLIGGGILFTTGTIAFVLIRRKKRKSVR
ncbi:MAG: SpaA isopeptide-forming pilin-related protein [Clostridiaceae bacterium]